MQLERCLRGEKTFFQILRTFYERYRGSTASTNDFIAVADELGGNQVAPLLRDWLYNPKVPAIPGGTQQ